MKKNEFGERLKMLLKQKQLTQAQVANAVGTSIPSVNRWTKGGEIEYQNLRLLASFLEVNWVWLRYGDEALDSLQKTAQQPGPMNDMRREYLDQILANESRMKTALQMAQIITWEWSVLTGTVTCSENAAELFGVDQEHLPNCMTPFKEMALNELIAQFGNEQPYDWDYEVVTKQQELRWFTSRAKLVFDSANRPLKIIGISADISARKRAEAALERSEYLTKKIIEIIPVGLWGTDETGKINLANPEIERIWGRTKFADLDNYDEYLGWWEDTGEQLKSNDWAMAKAFKTGKSVPPAVVNIRSFDGVDKTIQVYAVPLCDKENQVIGAIEVNQDITNLKKTERALRQQLGKYQQSLAHTAGYLIELDNNGQVSYVEPALMEKLAVKQSRPALNELFTVESATTIQAELNSLADTDKDCFYIESLYNCMQQPCLLKVIINVTSAQMKQILLVYKENKVESY